jgi:hypothetical protein
MGAMSKFVGYHTIDTTDKDGDCIHQTKLHKNLKENFKDLIEGLREFLILQLQRP